MNVHALFSAVEGIGTIATLGARARRAFARARTVPPARSISGAVATAVAIVVTIVVRTAVTVIPGRGRHARILRRNVHGWYRHHRSGVRVRHRHVRLRRRHAVVHRMRMPVRSRHRLTVAVVGRHAAHVARRIVRCVRPVVAVFAIRTTSRGVPSRLASLPRRGVVRPERIVLSRVAIRGTSAAHGGRSARDSVVHRARTLRLDPALHTRLVCARTHLRSVQSFARVVWF